MFSPFGRAQGNMKVATGKRLSKADFLQRKHCCKSILFPEVYPIIQSVVWYCEFSSVFFVVFVNSSNMLYCLYQWKPVPVTRSTSSVRTAACVELLGAAQNVSVQLNTLETIVRRSQVRE